MNISDAKFDNPIAEQLFILCHTVAGISSIAQCLEDLPQGVDHEGLGVALQSLCSDLNKVHHHIELANREEK